MAQWLRPFEQGRLPDEYDAKRLVRQYGINVPEGKRLDAGEMMDDPGSGSLFAVKVCSGSILHKTDAQGVMLNVDPGSMEACLKQMHKRFPDNSLLIEEQLPFSGPEFIVGVINDPSMGHAVMAGAGGLFTEIYKDTACRLVPCSLRDAQDMIDELILAPVFDSFRGIYLDRDKLAQVILKVSTLAQDMGQSLNQLDINPIVFSNDEWVALDVKVMLGQ